MKSSPDVVFITYDGLVDGDPDDLLALSILQNQGLKVSVIDWRKMPADEMPCGVAVLRSTWDYHHYLQDFIEWIDKVSSLVSLQNSAELVRWNVNKKYLLELAAKQIAIVPTCVINAANGNEMTGDKLREIFTQNKFAPDKTIIVKPAVGLATSGVKRFDLSAIDIASVVEHIIFLAGDGDVLLQPYLEEVEKFGERSLIYIDGQFSHSVRKSAFQKLAAAGEAGETSVTATSDQVAFGLDVLQKLKEIKGCEYPLYARVDVVPDSQGQIYLLELELIEPSLFLAMSEGAAERFARAIALRLQSASSDAHSVRSLLI